MIGQYSRLGKSALLTLALAMVGGISMGTQGCGSSSESPAIGTRPTQIALDERFVVSGQTSYVIGNAITSDQSKLSLTVSAPDDTKFLDAFVGDSAGVRLERGDDNVFRLEADVKQLPPGAYSVVFSANGKAVGIAETSIIRSHPLYAVMATDWDYADPGDRSMQEQDAWHTDFPNLKITHFVGPYTYTEASMTTERQALLSSWLQKQKSDFGDELGLHIHPYCSLVTASGVTCNTSTSIVYPQGDATGYSINVSAYNQADFEKIVAKSDELFTANGLGKPTSFRAGGWTASAHTLAALAAQGYVVDSSANNWARMNEWSGYEIYDWNEANWNPIGDTSQPYFPNTTIASRSDAPRIDILEVPDNGIMVDYVSTPELKQIFEANLGDGILTAPKVFVFGFHPSPNQGMYDFKRIREILTELEMHSAHKGAGIVEYQTMSELAKVWQQ